MTTNDLSTSSARASSTWRSSREVQVARPTPLRTEADLVRERIRLERICAIHDELTAAHLDPHIEKLLDELGVLDMANWTEGEDYMLRIAGKLCMEFGQADLWRAIFTAARDGSIVDTDDELRFLDHNFDIA